MEKHLFLIGMQGCGKSSLGKRTAKETGVPFADTDAIVAQSAGGTVNDFFEKYENSTAGKVSNAVNNTHLIINGTEGTKSYGLVVDLAVAYYKNK